MGLLEPTLDGLAMTHRETVPRLLTERLVLRAPGETDIPAWFERATDRESAYLAGGPIPADISEGKAWLSEARTMAEKGERLLWSIDIRNGPVSIGSVGLTLTEPGVSFVIGRPFWRLGYATEAARKVIKYGFEVLGISKVVSEFVVENAGSRRVHEKLGFGQVETFVDDFDGAQCERHILSARMIEYGR